MGNTLCTDIKAWEPRNKYGQTIYVVEGRSPSPSGKLNFCTVINKFHLFFKIKKPSLLLLLNF